MQKNLQSWEQSTVPFKSGGGKTNHQQLFWLLSLPPMSLVLDICKFLLVLIQNKAVYKMSAFPIGKQC